MGLRRERKFELFVLTEKNFKGNGEVSWCGINGIITDVQEVERAREGLPILFNNVWHSAVVDDGCVNSKIL